MVEIMIRSLKDQDLKTACGMGQYWLIEGEVRLVMFKNMAEFEALQDMGVLMPAPQGAEESKHVPVIPEVLHDGEETLELSNDPYDLEEDMHPEDLPELEELDHTPNDMTVAALEGEDLYECNTVDELMEDLEEDEDEEEDDWTNSIDHV